MPRLNIQEIIRYRQKSLTIRSLKYHTIQGIFRSLLPVNYALNTLVGGTHFLISAKTKVTLSPQTSSLAFCKLIKNE